MIESNKDNLENFFRKKTQNPDIDFNEEDWKKLEAQLDKDMPIFFPWLWLKKFWPIPIILILALIGWNIYMELDLSDNEITNIKETRVQQSLEEEKSLPEKDSEVRLNNQISSNHSPQNKLENTLLDSNSNTPANNLSKENKSKDYSLLDDGIYDSEDYQIIKENSGYVVLGNGDEALGLSEASSLHFLLPIPPAYSVFPSSFSSMVKMDMDEIEKKKLRKSSFIIGVGYSPDFSTVGIGNFVSPGSRWKLYLEYNFKNIAALSSGFEWVNNKYEAYGDEYHAPQRYWHNGIVADEAYGECVMIDIPVSIRIQALTRGRHQLFLSGGFSSYFLLKEDYYFHYDQDDPELPKYWGTDKMSVYPFAIINASLGYEYQLKSRGSLQIEPYIKIPTQGVGWGEVDLYTIGAYFSYRYRLIR